MGNYIHKYYYIRMYVDSTKDSNMTVAKVLLNVCNTFSMQMFEEMNNVNAGNVVIINRINILFILSLNAVYV